MDLRRLPKPTKDPKLCDEKFMMGMNQEGAPSLNLFANKQARGWWPFMAEVTESKEEKKSKEAKDKGEKDEEEQNKPKIKLVVYV